MALTTVNATETRKEYNASGGQVDFTVPFEFLSDAALKVYQVPDGATPDETTHILTLTTHYTVTGAGVSDPGTRKITLVTGATLDDKIIIELDEDIDRDTAFLSTGDLTIAAMNAELNKLILLNKQLSTIIKQRSILIDPAAYSLDLELPSPLANQLIGWNPTADALKNVATYQERYYGDYASAPATNPHTGAAPAEGDMYYDTTLNLMLVYNGATWGQINSSVATAANLVNIADAGGYFTATEVESALQEFAPRKGTFTPTIEGTSVVGTGWAYSRQDGYWAIHGYLLQLGFRITCTTIGAGASGNVAIHGMPSFTNTPTTPYAVGRLVNEDANVVHTSANYTEWGLEPVGSGTPHLRIKEYGGGQVDFNTAISQLTATFTINGQISIPI